MYGRKGKLIINVLVSLANPSSFILSCYGIDGNGSTSGNRKMEKEYGY